MKPPQTNFRIAGNAEFHWLLHTMREFPQTDFLHCNTKPAVALM